VSLSVHHAVYKFLENMDFPRTLHVVRRESPFHGLELAQKQCQPDYILSLVIEIPVYSKPEAALPVGVVRGCKEVVTIGALRYVKDSNEDIG